MISSRLSFLSLAFITPCMVNAATLQFDFSATQDIFGNNVGVQPGSYFLIDTTVVNTSSTAGAGLFDSAVNGGHIDVVDLNGPASYELTDAVPITTSTSSNGLNTVWTIGAATGPQPAQIELTFSGLDLITDLSDDFSIYNDSFLGGSVTTTDSNPLIGETTINIGSDFLVSDVSDLAPVPLPPTFYLMASSLIMLLWRSNLSFSSAKTLMTS